MLYLNLRWLPRHRPRAVNGKAQAALRPAHIGADGLAQKASGTIVDGIAREPVTEPSMKVASLQSDFSVRADLLHCQELPRQLPSLPTNSRGGRGHVGGHGRLQRFSFGTLVSLRPQV